MSAIILFDGVCNFCNGWVNFVIERDRKNLFKFAPLQSEIGQKLLGEYRIVKTASDSVVLIADGRAFTHSNAILQIARRLGGIWLAADVFYLIPKFPRDFFYKLFARNRYRFFGKKEVCMMPTPEIRERFLVMN